MPQPARTVLPCLLAGLALFVGVAVPANARPSDDHSTRTQTSESAGRPVEKRIKVDPAALLPSDRLPRTQELLTTTRSLLSDLWDVEIPDLRARSDSSSNPERAAADGEPERASIKQGLPAGDMTGDGSADVVVSELTFTSVLDSDYSYSVTGIDGKSGATLWERSFSDALDSIPLSAPDMSGDGLGDVVVLTFFSGHQKAAYCGSTACAQAEGGPHRWTIHVLSGDDGSDVWTRSVDGARAGAGGNVSLFPPGIINSDSGRVTTAATVLPVLGGDHDGDGARDLLINEYDVVSGVDYRYTNQGGNVTSNGTYPNLTGLDAAIVSGATGEPIWERHRDPLPGTASLLSAGPSVGSAHADVLWQSELDIQGTQHCRRGAAGDECSTPETSELDVEILDGSSLSTEWATTIADETMTEGFVRPSGSDLDGVGGDDLLLYRQDATGEGNERQWSIGVIEGASGSLLWRRASQGYPDTVDGTSVGPVGGGPGDDILVLSLHVRPGGDGFEVVLERVDGATGDVLLTTTRILDRTFMFFLSPMGDADGDGVDDFAFSQLPIYTPDPSIHSIESGRDGSELLRTSSERFVYALGAGDLDRDGHDDLVELTTTASPDRDELVRGLSATGQSLWTFPRPPGSVDADTSRDLDGDGVDDVLVSWVSDDVSRPTSSVTAVDGRTGIPLWNLGAGLPDLLGTVIRFTAASPAEGQVTDDVVLSARITTAEGEPLEGVALRFTLSDGAGVEVPTDADGVAVAAVRLTGEPGEHLAGVAFDGDPRHAPSQTSKPLTILKEDSSMSLDVSQRGPERTLTARLSDADGSTQGIGGRELVFLVDSEIVAHATTGADGVARVTQPKQGGARSYEVHFAGDDYFLASGASARPGR